MAAAPLRWNGGRDRGQRRCRACARRAQLKRSPAPPLPPSRAVGARAALRSRDRKGGCGQPDKHKVSDQRHDDIGKHEVLEAREGSTRASSSEVSVGGERPSTSRRRARIPQANRRRAFWRRCCSSPRTSWLEKSSPRLVYSAVHLVQMPMPTSIATLIMKPGSAKRRSRKPLRGVRRRGSCGTRQVRSSFCRLALAHPTLEHTRTQT